MPADSRNRIPLALRCLLIETPDVLVLVDNGVGNKENEKFHEIYGIDNGAADGRSTRTRLDDAIAAAGFTPDMIDIVIDTHLHFDHAGGNTTVDDEGRVHISFPGAKYVVQRGEWDWAHIRNERISASYLAHNFDPIREAGRFELIDGDHEIVPGISVVRTPGHTPHHQSVLVHSEDETACFLADLVPTSAHLPLPWIMGYDVEPLVTLETKRALLGRAFRESWLLIFEHDPVSAWGRLTGDASRPTLSAEDDA